MSNSEAKDMDTSLGGFVKRLALFLLPLIFAAFFADRYISVNLRKSVDGELGAWNEVYAGRIDSEIVVYGTSRAVGQFDPQILSQQLGMTAYNLGMLGNNFGIQYLRHEILLRHNRKPKLILQSVEPFTFLKRKDPFDPEQFLPYMLDDTSVRAATAQYDTYNYWDRHVPMARYYGRPVKLLAAMRLSLRGAEGAPERKRGYKTLDVAWDGNSERARRYWLAQNLVPDPEAMALFERYLQECRAGGIRVIFVSPPEYVDTWQFVPYRREIRASVVALSEKYGIPILDYSENWMTDKHYLFSDALHLNTTGVAIFTTDMAADVRVILAQPVRGMPN
jgi:hypothetical protein